MSGRILLGGAVLDEPERVPAVWGRGDEVLWAMGEPLILAGPPGVGKTTIAQQVALARIGLPVDLRVLGFEVCPDPDRRVLYVAADRPRQAKRSMRRMVTERDRERLDDQLVIHAGPIDALDPAELLAVCGEWSIGTVVLDSVKDVAGDPADGKVGQAFNSTLQHLVGAGVEVMALHHNRKGQVGNARPRKLDDLYGSTWIAAGAGSVVSLWGEPGDSVVELRHLKQPAGEVGPLTVLHDHAAGTSRASAGSAAELIDSTPEGLTAKEAAAAMDATSDPTRSQIEKARRKLEREVKGGLAERVEPVDENAPTKYRVRVREGQREGSRPDHGASRNGSTEGHATLTGPHAQGSSGGSPPIGGARDPDREGPRSLEDDLLDPEAAEAIRAMFDGEWVDESDPHALVRDLSGEWR